MPRVPVAKTPIWLSIDWDSFIPEMQEWDFGHSEGHHPDLQMALWQIRAASSLARGQDLRKLTAFRENQHPDDFCSDLARKGFKLEGAEIAVAESHMYAASWFTEARGVDGVASPNIVHFDAHHDLGYQGMQSLNDHVRKQRADAGNWLGVFLRLFPRTKATLVLSSWKPDVVAETLKQAPMTPSVRKRVTVQQWPELPAGGQVTRVFVCRSGAWSPPWHDRAFADFIAALKVATHQGDVTQLEPTECRAWNDAAIEAQAAVQRDMMNNLRPDERRLVLGE